MPGECLNNKAIPNARDLRAHPGCRRPPGIVQDVGFCYSFGPVRASARCFHIFFDLRWHRSGGDPGLFRSRVDPGGDPGRSEIRGRSGGDPGRSEIRGRSGCDPGAIRGRSGVPCFRKVFGAASCIKVVLFDGGGGLDILEVSEGPMRGHKWVKSGYKWM